MKYHIDYPQGHCKTYSLLLFDMNRVEIMKMLEKVGIWVGPVKLLRAKEIKKKHECAAFL